jgi:hypothetical protein
LSLEKIASNKNLDQEKINSVKSRYTIVAKKVASINAERKKMFSGLLEAKEIYVNLKKNFCM